MADAVAVLSRTTRGLRGQALLWLAIGLGLLAGSAAALYSSTRNDLEAAYASAPPCATLADADAGKNCRYTTTANVTQVIGDARSVEVIFDVPGQSGSFYSATLPGSDTSLSDGDQVQVEFWGYRVTRLGRANTVDNPANDPRQGTLLIIALVLLLLGVGATARAILRAREQRRAGQAQANAGLGMGPVAMSDVLWR